MDKTLVGLIAAASALAIPAAQAATAVPPPVDPAMRVNSYSDLLKPIPNALEIMKASAAAPAKPAQAADGAIEQAQVYLQFGPPRPYYHHHHHHHHWYRHHHHHHHHND